MMKFSFSIKNMQAMIPEEFKDDFKDSHLLKYVKPFELSHIPAIERRRLSRGTKCVLSLLHNIDKPIVYSSYKGEINRSLDLLYSLAESGVVSPTSFSLSVLNAVPAVSSIMYENHNDITAVSSSPSLENALLQSYINLYDTKKEQLVISYFEGAFKEYYNQNKLYCCLSMEVTQGEDITLEKCISTNTYGVADFISEIEFLKHYEMKEDYSIYTDNTEWKWHFNA